MINWACRLKNKTFWLALIPAILVLIQAIAAPFGYQWDFVVLNQQLTAIINAAFVVLSILGIAVDPTTDGISDSQLAMSYSKPRKDIQEEEEE